MSKDNAVVENLRAQLKGAHDWLDGTLQGVDDALANAVPSGKVATIGANFAHVVTFEDYVFNALLTGGAPLMMSTSPGISAPPPAQGPWDEWGRSVKANIGEQRAYAQKVYAAGDAYLASIQDQDLAREVEAPFAKMPLGQFISLMILNAHCHAGEISCIKGQHNMQGYPL